MIASQSLKLQDLSRPILVFGRDGQVGKSLQKCLINLNQPVVFLGRSDCDLSCENSISNALNFYLPQIVINAAAFTAVDKAENEQELAFSVNGRAPGVIARYVANVNYGILIHYSTDYVFSGAKQVAYDEFDRPGPSDQLNIYGQSKLAGEQSIIDEFKISHAANALKSADKFSRYLILRTSWVYGDGSNFIRSILNLAIKNNQLKVVSDQIGCPTSAQWLAEITIKLAESESMSGVYHVVPDGKTSWYELAIHVVEAALNFGVELNVKPENILPIKAVEYSALAKRPYNSCLNNAKLKKILLEMNFTEQYPLWQNQVKDYVNEYALTCLKKNQMLSVKK